MVAKPGLMITPLGGTKEKLALKGLEFKSDSEIPALSACPKVKTESPQWFNIRISD
jgi:hypothetical protein